MTDDNDSIFENLTRRRVLGGIVTVGAAGAAAGAGTAAYFSDSAESTNNTIESGNITLDAGNDSINNAAVRVGKVKPGQTNTKQLNLSNTGSIDGFLSLDFGVPDARNDLTEVLEVEISIAGNTIRKGTFDTVFDGEGEWSNADIPLSAANTKPLDFKYTLPSGASQAGAQSAQARADFDILLNQQEEAFADIVVDSASGQGNVSTIQEGVNDVPEDGVVLVRDGVYQETVTVDKPGVKIASKNGPRVGGSAPGTALVADTASNPRDNKVVLIDGVDDVTVDGLRVSLGAAQTNNNEKFAIRGRVDGSGNSPNDLTVRNCLVNNISAGASSASASVVATGITLDLSTGTNSAQASNFVVENNTIENLTCTSTAPDDSRAKGIAVNNDVNGVKIVRNTIKDIGQDPETDKPRGITLTEDSDKEGPTNFTILDNTIQNVAGGVGQPALFVGGSNGLGDHEVYNNVFYQPVDNLSGQALRLRENTWENDADDDGVPELVPTGSAGSDGGNLIDRAGGANYDTTYTI